MSNGSEPSLLENMRSVGLRPTRVRLFVMETMVGKPNRWLNPDEIHEDLTTRGRSVNRCSIYGAIKDLHISGLLLRECHDSLNGGRLFYILNPSAIDRDTSCAICIVCRECRCCSFNYNAKILDQIRSLASLEHICSSNQHVSIFVTCNQCAGLHKPRGRVRRQPVRHQQG